MLTARLLGSVGSVCSTDADSSFNVFGPMSWASSMNIAWQRGVISSNGSRCRNSRPAHRSRNRIGRSQTDLGKHKLQEVLDVPAVGPAPRKSARPPSAFHASSIVSVIEPVQATGSRRRPRPGSRAVAAGCLDGLLKPVGQNEGLAAAGDPADEPGLAVHVEPQSRCCSALMTGRKDFRRAS